MKIICPNCDDEMHPTCLGCGGRYECNHCGLVIKCSCTR